MAYNQSNQSTELLQQLPKIDWSGFYDEQGTLATSTDWKDVCCSTNPGKQAGEVLSLNPPKIDWENVGFSSN